MKGKAGGGGAGLLGGLIVGGGAAVLVAATPTLPSPVAALAGRYNHHFTDGLVDGSSYPADDVAEIVPVDATHAYVRFALNFYNGHSCSLSGIATARGDALVYTEPADAVLASDARCTLTVRRDGGKLAWDDAGSCKGYCGARGSFLGGGLPWSSRRPIAYLHRLRGSREYEHALTEWRTGHAAPWR